MAHESAADEEIRRLAQRLTALKERLGEAYWDDAEVKAAQDQLRSEIGRYGAWGEDKLPMHQRSRVAARYESEFAALLWPR